MTNINLIFLFLIKHLISLANRKNVWFFILLLRASASVALGSKNVELSVGQIHVIPFKGLKRIAIGNGKVLQATPLENEEVLVIPETPGQSSLYLWDKKGKEMHYSFRVVSADAKHLLIEIQEMIGHNSKINARIIGDKVVLDGSDLSEEEVIRLEEIAKRYPQLVNLVSKVGLEKMIELDVQLVEIRRNAIEQLGVQWNNLIQGPTFGLAFGEGASKEIYSNEFLPNSYWNASVSLGTAINLLVQNGDAVVLANPKLSCMSGGAAHFVSGGELPIPFSSGFSGTSVGFKEYGVKFDFHPIVSKSELISLKVAVEISSINFEVQVQSIPGLNKRKAETEVNLHQYETLVIAGLLTEEASRSINKFPFLGDVPILGKLFQSKNYQDRKTELVVFVTPRFVSGSDQESPYHTAIKEDVNIIKEDIRN